MITAGMFLVSYWMTALSPIWLLLSVPLFSAALLLSSILVHECAHDTLFPWAPLNAVVGTLAGILCWTPFLSYRRGHNAHHQWIGSFLDRDPTPSPRGHVAPNGFLTVLLRITIVPVFYWAGVYLPYLLYDLRPTTGRPDPAHVGQLAINAVGIVLVHVVFAYWVGPFPYLAVAILGFLGWGILYENLFTLNQHIGLKPIPEAKDRYAPWEQMNFARTVPLAGSGLLLHFNHHKEHHLLPQLNYQYLPHAHAFLRDRRPDILRFTIDRLDLVRRRSQKSHELLTPRAGDSQ